MQTDKRFRVSGRWALASDGAQWVIQRKDGSRWHSLKFVHTTRDILARCMRETEMPYHDMLTLLDDLPDTFDDWRGMVAPSAPVIPLPA
jgi:hypothetical protein